MRVLCITQNLPGELEPVASGLAADPQNMVFMAALRQSRNVSLPGVRRIILKKCNASRFEKNYLGYCNLALANAGNAARSFASLEAEYYPDMALVCASNGIGFAVPQIFPRAFMVSYADTRLLDFPVCGHGFYDSRLMIQKTQLMQSDLGFIRDPFQQRQLKGLDRSGLHYLPPMVDTEFFKPDEAREQTEPAFVVASGSIAEKQLAIFWNQLGELLKKMPACRVALLAEGGLQGWRWEEMARALPGQARERVTIEYSPLKADYLRILRQADFLLCLACDMSVSQRILEAMSAGTLVVAGASRLDYLHAGRNVLAFHMFENRTVPGMASAVFKRSRDAEITMIKEEARKTALRFDQKRILPGHIDFLLKAMRGKSPAR